MVYENELENSSETIQGLLKNLNFSNNKMTEDQKYIECNNNEINKDNNKIRRFIYILNFNNEDDEKENILNTKYKLKNFFAT